jgi:hypothetical protein
MNKKSTKGLDMTDGYSESKQATTPTLKPFGILRAQN